jgi:ribosomal protein S11
VAADAEGNVYFADYGNNRIRVVAQNKATPTIAWSTPSTVTYGTALSSAQLDATASVPGTFVYSPASGTVLGAGTQTLSVSFTPYDTDDYNNASATVSLQVNKVTPTVSVLCSPNPITYGGANSICSAYVSDGATGTVSFTVNSAPWTTVALSSGSAAAQFSSTNGIGTFTVGATYNGDSNNATASGSGTVSVNQVSQTITFTPPVSPVTYGVAPIALAATGGASGNAVVFSVSSGPCSVSGSTLTVTGAGTCVVAANQPGSSDYSAAAQVTQRVTVNRAVLTVTANSALRAYGAANPTFGYTVTGFVNGDTPSVVGGSAAETTSATSSSAPGSYSITFSSEALSAANYTFIYVNGTLTVTQASQTISFTAPASPVTYGVSPISLSATASSGLAVNFSVSSGPCSVSGSALTVTGAGTCVVAANQPGNADFSAAAQVTHSVTVNRAALVVTANSASRSYGAANPTFGYAVTGFVNGDTQSVVGGSAAETTSATTSSTPGSYAISFSSEALTAANYTFSYVNGSLTVTQASQTITFPAPASPVTYGVSPISLSASASSGLAVAFSVSSGSCSVSGSTLTVSGAGACVVAANQAGSTDYSAAATVSHSIVVNAAVLTVTANNASRAYGAANPTFTASFSGFVNGDTLSVLSGALSLTATATPTSAPGTYTITSAAGTLAASNYTFNFANGTLTVIAATQTISFTAPVSPVTYGVSPIFLSATASSGLAVIFTVSSGPCTVSGNRLTAAGAGICVVAANQPGNADYTAAAAVVQSLVINKESVMINATSSLSPSIYGDNVALTFTVTGSGITPTGTVTISDGANTLATISLDAGIATFSTSALIAGKHSLTAVYSGDNNYQ